MAINDDKNVKKQTDAAKRSLEETKQQLSEIAKKVQEFSTQISASLEIVAAGFDKINDKIKDNSESIESLSDQTDVFEMLQESMQQTSEDTENSTKLIGKLADAIKKQGKQQEEASKAAGFKKGGDGKNNVYEQISKSSKNAAKGLTLLSAASKALSAAFNTIKFGVTGLIDVISSLFGAAMTLGKLVFNFVSALWEKVFDMAKEMMQQGVEYARAVEEIREKFGDVSKGVGKAVVDMGNQIFAGGAAGLSGFALFENKADALRKMGEMAAAGGAAFELLIDQFRGKNLNDLYAFKEGLGLTNEEFAGMTRAAIVAGKPIKSLMLDVQKYARGLTNEFGGTAKAFKSISRDIVKARMDVRHFANVATKDLAAAAMYARKLGVELEKIVGIMDAFDTFDSAAENVSKLSQAFGVNLDVMELMSAKTPTEQVEMIKKSFAAAGKSVETMNRQELKYLATTLSLDEATTQQLLSTKNQGVAMDKLNKSTKSMEHQMLDTASAMKDIMGEIKKVVREIQIQGSGFFSVFLEGFMQGIVRSGPFRNMLKDIAQAIVKVRNAGIKLGMIFVETFPGLKKMMESLGHLMPKISNLFTVWGNTAANFFKQLKEGKANVDDFIDSLIGDTKGFFRSAGKDGEDFLDGVSEVFGAFGTILKGIAIKIVKTIGEVLQKAFSFIADVLEGKKSISEILSNQFGKVGGAATKGYNKAKKELSPVWDALVGAFEKVQPQLERIWNAIVEKMKKGFDEFLDYLGKKWQSFDLIGFIANNPKASFMLTLWGISKFPGVVSAGADFAKFFFRGFSSVGIPALKNVFENVQANFAPGGAGLKGLPGMMSKNTKVGGGMALAGVAAGMGADKLYESGHERLGGAARMGSRALEFGGLGMMVGGPLGAAAGAALGLAYATAFDGALDDVLVTKLPSAEKVQKTAEDILSHKGALKVEISKTTTSQSFLNLKENLDQQRARYIAEATSTWNVDDQEIENMHGMMEEYFASTIPQMSEAQIRDLAKQEEYSLNKVGEGLNTARMFSIKQLEEEHKGEYLTMEQLGELGLSDQAKAVFRSYQRIRKLNDAVNEKSKAAANVSTSVGASASASAEASAAAAKKAEEEGKRMMEETIDEMGLTTVDNVDERIKKILSVGEKISGSKDKFEEQMKKVRADLASMNFSLFENEGDRNKFAKNLGDASSILTFITTMEKLIVSMDNLNKAATNFGGADQQASILGKFLKNISSIKSGFESISNTFKGAASADFSGIESFIQLTEKLSDHSGKIVENLEEFGENVGKIQVSKTMDAIRGLSRSLADMQAEMKKTLEEGAKGVSIKLAPAQTNLAGKGGVQVKSTPIQQNIKIEVQMKTSDIEQMIFKDSKSITLEGLNKTLEMVNAHQADNKLFYTGVGFTAIPPKS